MYLKDSEEELSKVIEKVHANGLICNISGLDDKDEIQNCLTAGVDTILTSNYMKFNRACR